MIYLQTYLIYIQQAIILAFAFYAGKHDGDSHLSNRKLLDKEQKVWHRSGYIYYSIACALIFFISWKLSIVAVIARASAFDIGYNIGAKFKFSYIGDGTQFWERLFMWMFGANGGVKKAIAFILLLIVLNVINAIYQ